MRNLLSGLAQVLTVIFTILFVITAVVAITFISIDRNLLRAGGYKSALLRTGAYDRLPDILAGWSSSSLAGSPCAQGSPDCEDIPSFIQNLSQADLEIVLMTLVPPEDLQIMTESMLDQTFEALDGERDVVSLSLAPLRENLTGQAGVESILQIFHAQPACSLEELVRITGEIINGNLAFCNPPEAILNTLLPLFQDYLKTMTTRIPSEIVLFQVSGSGTPTEGPLVQDPVGTFRTIRLILRLSLLLPLGILLLMTILNVRSLKDWLRGWGIPFFFTGLLALGFAIVILILFSPAWTGLIATRLPAALPAGMIQLVHDLSRSLIQPVITDLAIAGGVLALIGLAAWIGSRYIKIKFAS